MGSNVIARQGDVTLIGQQVNIVAALDTARSKEFHEIKQSGLSVTASNPVVSAVQTGERMASAASKVDNPVMQGLAAGTAGLAAYNAYDAVQKMGSLDKATSLDKVGGVSVQISLGSSKSTSTTERNASSAAGSTVAAGKDLTIIAQGAGRNSDITVTGSNLSAGGNAVLKAEGDVLLQAARNAFEQKTDSRAAAPVSAWASTWAVRTRASRWSWAFRPAGARPTAGRKLDQQPCCRWQHAGVPIWRRYDAEGRIGQGRPDHRVGGRQPAAGEPAGHQQVRRQEPERGFWRIDLPDWHMREQRKRQRGPRPDEERLQVGDRADGSVGRQWRFLIDVKNNTTLIGSVIASSDKAVADGLNKLSTGTLVTEDVKNKANYSAYQVSVGGGIGLGWRR